MQELLVQLWNEQQGTVFLVTHSVEEAVYLGDRVFVMAAKPGRLVEILPQYAGPALDINVVYPSRLHLSHKVRVMVEFLSAAFAQAGHV